jgi:hypothetical protein
MIGSWVRRQLLARLAIGVAAVTGMIGLSTLAHAAVEYADGFGDADRNNDGAITFYDTDVNDSGTWNDPTEDMGLPTGFIEVTAAQNPSDVGIIWSGIRSFDTAANIAKSRLRIINDSVATGSETASEIHGDGLALAVESRGGGSSFIGRFPQSVDLGPMAGDKVVVSVDFRTWRESPNPTVPPVFNELRWGLFEDTDNEFGMTGPFGVGFLAMPPGATVEWGKEDGNWFASQPGAEGDKGIHAGLTFGELAAPVEARIRWEHSVAGINGTTNNGRIMEGNGVSDTAGTGGDTATIATPGIAPDPGNGPGAVISNETNITPHKLSLEIVRLADGLVEVASFVNGVEALRDSIKMTDTGFNVIGPPPFSYDYVAFRNASGDFDYAIDNFMIEVIGSNESGDLLGDYNENGTVDAADYVSWREGNINGQQGYLDWRANFGRTLTPGSSSASVPEPAGLALLVIGGLLAGSRRRGNSSAIRV